MSKTLRETLKDIPRDYNVKIGAVEGSSFFYCSKVSQFSKDLNKIEKKLILQLKKKIKQTEERLANIDKIYDIQIEQAHKNSIKKHHSDRKWLAKRLQTLQENKDKELYQLPRKLKALNHDLVSPLYDREVVEIVNGISPDEQPCKIIYIKGHETGACWTVNEYEKKGNTQTWFK